MVAGDMFSLEKKLEMDERNGAEGDLGRGKGSHAHRRHHGLSVLVGGLHLLALFWLVCRCCRLFLFFFLSFSSSLLPFAVPLAVSVPVSVSVSVSAVVSSVWSSTIPGTVRATGSSSPRLVSVSFTARMALSCSFSAPPLFFVPAILSARGHVARHNSVTFILCWIEACRWLFLPG